MKSVMTEGVIMEKKNMETVWGECLSFIKDKVTESSFDLWFKPIRIEEITESEVVLTVPNRFFKEWIEDNYPQLVKEALEQANSAGLTPVFRIKQSDHPAEPQEKETSHPRRSVKSSAARSSKGMYVNGKYTFESFVVGTSNQFAHAAAMKVSEAPGKVYNPLFIYGDVGLGKTHIINAIGNRIIDVMSNMTVLYVSSEQFTNEVVSAIRHDKMMEFKDKYRGVDVLMIDDIQFIANKTQTQEEFFHTFNALYEKQKQIIISSDKPPKELGSITDRLKSRFTMGLVADIQPPTFEHKKAILQKKAEIQRINLPDDVAEFLSNRIKSNIRELEGSLIKLAAHSGITGNPISEMMARDVLKDIFRDEDKQITIEFIQKIVCDYYGIKVQDIKAKKRTKELTTPRQVAMYISKKLTNLSLGDIGNAFGGKNHATVIYSCKQVEEKISGDDGFNRVMEQLVNKIKP
jgi:chromosomal replication initiator protein